MIKINSVYQTNNYGPIKVIAKLPKNDFYQIMFLDTGTEKEARGYQITNGCVRDQFAKSFCGVAATGNIKTKGKYKPYYSVWHDMINRCYNENDKRYNAYKNVNVDERWLIFENFYEDAPKIEGFDEQLFLNGDLVLDKDIKQRHKRSKIYSLNTCTWVSKHDNNVIQDSQQKPFIAISPTGERYREWNITEFARRNGLRRRNISAVLHGRGKTVKKWTFYYEEIV